MLLWLHGGGFVAGDLDTHDELCRRLAFFGAVTVVAIAYRLAPEHPFPAAVEDAHAAFAALGPGAGIGGDSAGGYLAAAVAATGAPAFQVLVYPWLDPHATTPSLAAYGEGHGLTRAELAWYRAQFACDPGAAPLRGDVARVPRTYVATAELDPLRDEGERYAALLADVTLRRHAGLEHGFVEALGTSAGGRRAVAEIGAWLAEGCASASRRPPGLATLGTGA